MRADKYATGKFRGPPNSKDGYAISDCIDDRHRRVLVFVIPILYPEKPIRVTVMVANTIFGAMEGRVVRWGKVIGDVVAKLAGHVAKSKYSPISPYLYHLYHHKEVLALDEIVTYNTGSKILKYGLTNELEPDHPESKEEKEAEAKEAKEDALERWGRRRKSIDPAARRTPPCPEPTQPI